MPYKIEAHTHEFLSFVAGGTITIGELVALDNTGRVVTATASTTNVVGIADESKIVTEEIRILQGNIIVYAESGGAIAAGATLETVAAGQVDDTTAGTCQTIGVAFEAATAGSQWIRCYFNFPVFR
jgi:hypothetical protein